VGSSSPTSAVLEVIQSHPFQTMGGKRSRELLEAVDVGMRILLGIELHWHTSSVGTRIPLVFR
jgi:hypothetical protein